MVKVRVTRKNVFGNWESSFENISEKQLKDYKKQAYKFTKVDWNDIYKKYNHVIVYSELYDEEGKPYYANIYLDGTCFACDEQTFEELYQRPRQFTIAVHRPGGDII